MVETYQGLVVWATVGRCHTGQPPEAPACWCITAAARKIGPSHYSVLPCRREGSDSSTTARPLEGGALALGRTRAPARGPTVAPSTTAAVAPALVSARRCQKGSLGVAALGAAADRTLQIEEARWSPAVHAGEGG